MANPSLSRQSSLQKALSELGATGKEPSQRSSLQKALSEVDIKSRGPTSDDVVSPRVSPKGSPPRKTTHSRRPRKVMDSKKASSTLHREVIKGKADSFLEQYDRQAQQRGKMRL